MSVCDEGRGHGLAAARLCRYLSGGSHDRDGRGGGRAFGHDPDAESFPAEAVGPAPRDRPSSRPACRDGSDGNRVAGGWAGRTGDRYRPAQGGTPRGRVSGEPGRIGHDIVVTGVIEPGRAAGGRRVRLADREATAGLHGRPVRSEEHTSELQSPCNLVCRLLLEKKKNNTNKLAS